MHIVINPQGAALDDGELARLVQEVAAAARVPQGDVRVESTKRVSVRAGDACDLCNDIAEAIVYDDELKEARRLCKVDADKLVDRYRDRHEYVEGCPNCGCQFSVN